MKKIILNIIKQGWPYVLAFYFTNKLTETFVIIRSDDILVKLQNLEHALPVAFANPLPSLRQQALIGGLVGMFAVFFVIQNARDKKRNSGMVLSMVRQSGEPRRNWSRWLPPISQKTSSCRKRNSYA